MKPAPTLKTIPEKNPAAGGRWLRDPVTGDLSPLADAQPDPAPAPPPAADSTAVSQKE